jgi:tetratricopeptide (TPR) repeat protein
VPSQRAPITCDTQRRATQFSRERANEVIAAWDAFEAREPFDPRLSVNPLGGTEILFSRAILHTKLATAPAHKHHLVAAAQDYEKMLARADGNSVADRVLGNLAETYMMQGRMEDALETYRSALRNGQDTATFYGYAVALDRDESSRQALDIIRALGPEQRALFYSGVEQGNTFFVPEGEKYYYFAMADEAFGFEDEAIENWTKYIASKAHPEFQPRAKAHLDALLAKKRRRSLPIDVPWPGVFR